MRKNGPFLVAVAVLGVAAGTAIAGLPSGGDDFVIGSGSGATVVTASSTTLAAVASQAPVPTTVAAAAATTTTLPSAPASTAVTTTTITSTTITSTLPAAPTSSTSTSTTSVAATLPRDQVRIVLANGDGRFNLVGRNADRLLAAGYVTIDQTDVSDRPATTIIYFRPGFDDEAAVLATDLLTPGAQLLPLPATPVTTNDGAGDLVVVLGPDALR